MSKFIVVITDEENGLEENEETEEGEEESNFKVQYYFDPVLSFQDLQNGQITQAQDAGLLVLDVLGVELENAIEQSNIH